MKKFVGNEALTKSLTLIKNALAQKQDLLEEITAEETKAMWDSVGTEETA